MSVIKLKNVQHSNFFRFAKASAFVQSSSVPYDSSSDIDDYLTPKSIAEMTPGRSDRASRLLTASRLHLNSPPESPKHLGQVNPNVSDYYSYPMQISITFWLPDITDLWCQ